MRKSGRKIAWFSCGAASAVAAKLTVDKYCDSAEVVYCDTLASEHPDNRRFMDDVSEWIGRDVRVISSSDYDNVDDVFVETRYMAGINGARCTVEMKKMPRIAFQLPTDTHIFGFTADERNRISRFIANNQKMQLEWPLLESGITKPMCFEILTQAGIRLPDMYGLGYKNNNCLGCVKATSARYWNMIRRDFPDVFERRARQSRELGVRLTRFKGARIFLDELPVDYMAGELENISCGPECGSSMQ